MAPSDDARRLDHTGNAGARGVGFGAGLHLALQVGKARFQKLDPIDESGEGFPDRVGDEVVIEVDAAAEGEARSVSMSRSWRECRRPSSRAGTLSMTRNWLRCEQSSPISIAPSNLAPAPTTTRSPSVGWRLPWLRGTGAAQSDAVIDGDVGADFGGLADHDAHAVVDEEAPSDLRSRMDVDVGEESAKPGNQPRGEAPFMQPQPIRQVGAR